MAFELLKGGSVWLKQSTKLPDYWENGVYHEGDETVSYKELKACFVEPMTPEEAELSMSGVSSSEMQWLLTDETLKTYRDFETDSSLADVVYLSNPETGRVKPQAWVVYEIQIFENYDDFELIEASGHDYVIVKEGKL